MPRPRCHPHLWVSSHERTRTSSGERYGTGVLTLSGITGSGSAGRGCYIDNGAHVLPTSVSLTGTQGDVILGSASGTPYTWAQAPQVNASRLCRFGL